MPELDAKIRRWTAAVTTMSDAEIPLVDDALRAKYLARKQETLSRLDRIIREGKFEGADVEALANIAHQLAGVAAMFDEAPVGANAARLVETLEKGAPSTHGRPAAAFGKTLRALRRSMSN